VLSLIQESILAGVSTPDAVMDPKTTTLASGWETGVGSYLPHCYFWLQMSQEVLLRSRVYMILTAWVCSGLPQMVYRPTGKSA